MAGRLQHRRGNGRWRQSTMADFGLNVIVCECGGCNPYQFNEPKPTECGHCGKPLSEEQVHPREGD